MKTLLIGLSLMVVTGMVATVVADVPDPAREPCIDVRIAGSTAPSFDCLNAALAQAAERQSERSALQRASIDTGLPSSPTQIGLYNQAATRERLGSNFGVSARPQRPLRVYANPVLRGR